MKHILGLDLGTNSIGWAVIDSENKKIIDAGSRIFPMGVVDINKGEEKEKSTNAQRREFRQGRRQIARKRLRKIKLLELLVQNNMCPLSLDELRKWKNWDKNHKSEGRQFPDTPAFRGWLKMNPYQLRRKGVEGQLTLQELGRVLYHLIQRRGFASSRKEKDTGAIFDGKENMAGINETKAAMNGHTLGQFLSQVVPEEHVPFKRRRDEKGKDLRARGRYTLRDMYVEEFERIWRQQAPQLKLDDLTTTKNKRVFLKGTQDKKRNKRRIAYLQQYRDKVEVKEIHLELETRKVVFTRVDTSSTVSLHDMLGGTINFTDEGLHYDNKDSVLFYQRPLRSQKALLGKCRYETNKTLANISHPEVELYTVWQFVNNIKFGNKQVLSQEQKQELVTFLLTRKSAVKFEQLAKRLNMLHETFNYTAEDKTPAFPTHAQLQPLFSAAGWQKYAHDIWHDFYFYDDNQRLFDKLKRAKHYGLKKDITLDKIEAVVLKDEKYAGVSLKAIRNILPFLARGMQYSHAVLLGGVKNAFNYAADDNDRWTRFATDHEQIIRDIKAINCQKDNKQGDVIRKIKDYLADPVNNYAFAPDDKAFKKLYHPSQEIEQKPKQERLSPIENLRNPVVQRSLQEMRRLVNELMKTYGRFDRISVEMGRELKAGKKRRKQKQFEIFENNKKNEQARKLLAEYRLRPSRENVQKVLLFKEIETKNGHIVCPYTNKTLNINDVLGRGNAVQVEHIIPRSKSLDDSFTNKTICEAKFNQLKGNRTPYQFYQENPDPELWGARSWEQVAQRAFKLLPYSKAKRFTTKNGDWKTEEFVARQLNDDRYISKKTKEILSEVCEDILVMAGGVTAELRRLWGLNNVLQPALGVHDYPLEAKEYRDIPHWAVLDSDQNVMQVMPQRNPRPQTTEKALCITGEVANAHFYQKKWSLEFPATGKENGDYYAVLPEVQVTQLHKKLADRPASEEDQLVLRGWVKKGIFQHDSLAQKVVVDKKIADGSYYATFKITRKQPKFTDENQKGKHKQGIALYGTVDHEIFTSYIFQCQTNLDDGKYWMLLDLDFDTVQLIPTENPQPNISADSFILEGDVNEQGLFSPVADARFQCPVSETPGRYWAVMSLVNCCPEYMPVNKPQPEVAKDEKLIEGRVWVDTNTGEILFDPKKNRDDHRHHAIDAMVIALTNHRMVQELNRYNAQRDECKYGKTDRPVIEKPWPALRKDVEGAAQNILISHHKSNPVLKKVSMHVVKDGKKVKEQGMALRGQLHKETVFGKRQSPDVSEPYYHVRKPVEALNDKQLKKIVDKRIRDIVIRARQDEKPLYRQMKDLLKKRTKEGEEGEQLIDQQIRELKDQIDALYTLPNKKGEPVPIKKVRIREKLGNAELLKNSGEVNQYVNPRNNHHVLIYKDQDGNLQEQVVSLWEAAERQKQKQPVYQLPEKGKEIVASLEVNDMFVVGSGLSPDEICNASYATLSPFLYRVQKLSSSYYTFRHHLAATLDDDSSEIRIQSFKAWQRLQPVKVKLDIAGKLHLN